MNTRTIKFKVYDKSTKEMYHVNKILWGAWPIEPFCVTGIRKDGEGMKTETFNVNCDEECEEVAPHGFLVQFTGLHDSEGKEIYEGDVLESTWNGKKCVVEMEDGEWNYCPDGGSTNGKKGDMRYAGTKIIGNIYQNPELLAGEEN